MNKDLREKIRLELFTFNDGMVSDSDCTERVMKLCAEAAKEAVDKCHAITGSVTDNCDDIIPAYHNQAIDMALEAIDSALIGDKDHEI